MTDYGEPWDDQGHDSNIYDANGDCIATVFNHRARIIACVNYCKGYDNPADIPHAESYINMSLELEGAKVEVERLKAVNAELLEAAKAFFSEDPPTGKMGVIATSSNCKRLAVAIARAKEEQ